MKEKTGKCLEYRRRGGGPLEANGKNREGEELEVFQKVKNQKETRVWKYKSIYITRLIIEAYKAIFLLSKIIV